MENLPVKNNRQRPQKHFGRVLFAIVWPVVGYFIAGVSVGLLLSALGQVYPPANVLLREDSPFILVLNALLSILVFFVVALPFFRYFFGGRLSKKAAFGLSRPFQTSHIGAALAAFGAYFVLSTITIVVVTALVQGFDADQQQELGFDDPQAMWQLVILFISLVIVPPIMEELVFRGFLFGALRQQLSFWPAAIIVSAVFGFVHGQWNVGIDVFILSLFLCVLRERTGSLWASMILHGIKNSVAFTLLFIVGIS